MPDPLPSANDVPSRRATPGSKATEHLANERTFLAWVRTCIAIISLGFVVAKFGVWLEEFGRRTGEPQAASTSTHEHSALIGAVMMITGALLVPFAAWHNFRVSRDIEAGRLVPSYRLTVLISAMILLLTGGLVAYLLISTRGR